MRDFARLYAELDASTGTARLLEGGPIAAEIRAAVAEDVERFTKEQGRRPGLAVVIIGRDAPSTVYLEQILRGCAKVGIDARFAELEGEATEGAVVEGDAGVVAGEERDLLPPAQVVAALAVGEEQGRAGALDLIVQLDAVDRRGCHSAQLV